MSKDQESKIKDPFESIQDHLESKQKTQAVAKPSEPVVEEKPVDKEFRKLEKLVKAYSEKGTPLTLEYLEAIKNKALDIVFYPILDYSDDKVSKQNFKTKMGFPKEINTKVKPALGMLKEALEVWSIESEMEPTQEFKGLVSAITNLEAKINKPAQLGGNIATLMKKAKDNAKKDGNDLVRLQAELNNEYIAPIEDAFAAFRKSAAEITKGQKAEIVEIEAKEIPYTVSSVNATPQKVKVQTIPSQSFVAKITRTHEGNSRLNEAAKAVQDSLNELLKVAEEAKQKDLQQKLNTSVGNVKTALNGLLKAANQATTIQK